MQILAKVQSGQGARSPARLIGVAYLALGAML